MENETIFRIVLAALAIILYFPRKYYQWLSQKTAKEALEKDLDSRLLIAVESLLLGISLWSMIVYLVKPEWMAWSTLPFPSWLRWLGAGVGTAGTGLLIWVHVALGRNFFGGMKVREGHTLVTSGPYRWVRHPMYVAFSLLGLGYLFLSANWMVGMPWICGTALVIVSRLKQEEVMMVDEFGEEYLTYIERTRRFFPRL